MQIIADKLEKARKKEEQLRVQAAALERTKVSVLLYMEFACYCVVQVPVSVKSDPSRVYQPTAGWEHRMQTPHINTTPLTILPKRAVPTWRQGL